MENTTYEQRQHVRQPARLDAQLKVELMRLVSGKISQRIQSIVALAQTNNISIGGMSLHIVGGALDAKKSITPANAHLVVGHPIEVLLYDSGITVWGHVIRADGKKLELGLVIDKVSDVRRWKRLCSEQAEGISIFPDGPRIRRKRRS